MKDDDEKVVTGPGGRAKVAKRLCIKLVAEGRDVEEGICDLVCESVGSANVKVVLGYMIGPSI